MPNLCVVYFPGYDSALGVRPVETVLARGEFGSIDELVETCQRVRLPHLRSAYATGEVLIGPEHWYDPNKSIGEYPRGVLIGWLGTAARGSFETLLRRELRKYFPQECMEDD